MARIDKNDLSYSIRGLLHKMLPHGAPSQEQIAKHLGIGLRTLQRRLYEQGTNYKNILEQTRKKLTMDYIQQRHLTLSEISYLVGFSITANFHRAFKRWTNKSPGEYRERQLYNFFYSLIFFLNKPPDRDGLFSLSPLESK